MHGHDYIFVRLCPELEPANEFSSLQLHRSIAKKVEVEGLHIKSPASTFGLRATPPYTTTYRARLSIAITAYPAPVTRLPAWQAGPALIFRSGTHDFLDPQMANSRPLLHVNRSEYRPRLNATQHFVRLNENHGAEGSTEGHDRLLTRSFLSSEREKEPTDISSLTQIIVLTTTSQTSTCSWPGWGKAGVTRKRPRLFPVETETTPHQLAFQPQNLVQKRYQ